GGTLLRRAKDVVRGRQARLYQREVGGRRPCDTTLSHSSRSWRFQGNLRPDHEEWIHRGGDDREGRDWRVRYCRYYLQEWINPEGLRVHTERGGGWLEAAHP